MATKSLQILGSLNATAVQFTEQDLTEEQKAQARENIGAASLDDINSSGGGDSSWNDLQDKPFEEISPAQVITWDGNTDGLPSASVDLDMGDGVILTFACYKISDVIVTEELIKGTSFDCTTTDGSLSCEVDIVSEKTSNRSFYVTNSQVGAPLIYVVNQANDSVIYDDGSMTFTLTFPETGIWFLKGTAEGSVVMQTNSLTVPAVIKTLDLKYLPSNMALGYEEKPFDDITWDGIATNKEMVTVLEMEMPEDEGGGLAGYYLVKISDTPIANASDVIGGYIQKYEEGQVYEPDEITSDIVISDNNCWWLVSNGMSYMINVTSLPASIDLTDAIGVTVELPSTGVYFIGGYLNRDFTTPMEYIGALKPNSKIVTIDPKFIPANLDFDLSDYYTKVEADNRYYSKSEVDTAIGNIDLSGYYTKTEIDNLIGDVDAILDEIDALIGE